MRIGGDTDVGYTGCGSNKSSAGAVRGGGGCIRNSADVRRPRCVQSIEQNQNTVKTMFHPHKAMGGAATSHRHHNTEPG